MKFELITLILNIGLIPIQDSTSYTINCVFPRFDLSPSKMVPFSTLNNSESTDKIYRLPPPGGTNVPDEIQLALRASFFFIRYLLKVSILKTLCINLIIDIDYDTMVGHNRSNFQHLVYRDLREKFHPDGFEVRNLFVQKGSVKISYEVRRTQINQAKSTNCDFSRNLLNIFRKSRRPCSNKLSPMSSISASKPNHDTNKPTVHRKKVVKREIVRRVQKRAVPNTRTSMRLAASFIVDVEYPAVSGGREEEFKNHILRELARQIRVPLSSVQDFNIQPGMKISFVLVATDDGNNVMDEKTVIEAADDLRSRLKNKQLGFTDLQGRQLTITKDRLITSDGQSTPLSVAVLGIIIGVMILMLGLVVIAGFATKFARTASKPLDDHVVTERVKKSKKSKAYRHIAAQDTGRESTQSLGRYSYDSGLWLGPGPEPVYTVPEAPLYRPPTVEQLSSTPRPATSLRTRLKKHWNIDPDQTLPPIPDGVEKPWDENTRHYHRRHSRDNNRFQHDSVLENETYS